MYRLNSRAGGGGGAYRRRRPPVCGVEWMGVPGQGVPAPKRAYNKYAWNHQAHIERSRECSARGAPRVLRREKLRPPAFRAACAGWGLFGGGVEAILEN